MGFVKMRVTMNLLDDWLQLPATVRIARVDGSDLDAWAFGVVLESPAFPDVAADDAPLVTPQVTERVVEWDWRLPVSPAVVTEDDTSR